MSDDEVKDRKTVSVAVAGREWFGMGRSASYAAAENGELPVIKIGRLLRVPVVALDRMLEETRCKKVDAA
jgi:hypothetical protein